MLIESENYYKINHVRTFKKDGELPKEDVEICLDFAYDMAFGEGKHRSNRSGGDIKRKPGEIFINTFQGKAAEFAMYRYFLEFDIKTTYPDLSITGYGKWDSFDLMYKNYKIAVKSTKFFGNLLLLETKDWNENGEYIPNIDSEVKSYDMLILLRMRPDVEKELQKHTMAYVSNNNKKLVYQIIKDTNWEYNIAGYITNKDLVRLIQKEYILPKGAVLNGKTLMDAENYYVQAGDMRTSDELISRLKRVE